MMKKATIALALLILSSIDISMAEEKEIISINEGEAFELKCATNLQYPVVWYFQQIHQTQEIFLGGEVSMTFQTMFRLTGNQSLGEYNLHIPSADGKYVGNFRCIDDEGLGSELRSIQINIIASTSAATIDENAPAANHEALKAEASSFQNDEHSNSITNPAVVFGIVLSVVIVAAIPIIIIIVVKRKYGKKRELESDAARHDLQVPVSNQEVDQVAQRSRILSQTSTTSDTPLLPGCEA